MTPSHFRGHIEMSPSEQGAMLSTGIRLALATHNSDGTIHLVPMNYVVEHRIRLLAKAKSQKVINAHREPRERDDRTRREL